MRNLAIWIFGFIAFPAVLTVVDEIRKHVTYYLVGREEINNDDEPTPSNIFELIHGSTE